MAPVRSYTNWNQRPSDQQEQIEPFQKIFFICEGSNTETFYFKKLVDLRKDLGIHPLVDVRLMEKTGKDKTLSSPKRLILFAEEQKSDPCIAFDRERDKMIIVFDADIYEKRQNDYSEIIKMAKEKNSILAVTNPAFELFLLLHYEKSYEENILPHKEEILDNGKVNGRRFIDQLFSEKSGMNSKKNPKIGDLVREISVAIEQEKKLNQDVEHCKGHLTSNIGKIISEIQRIEVP